MTPRQYIRGLVIFAFILNVTSHPTSYGSRLINFLDGIGGGGGGGSDVASSSIANSGIESRRFGSGSGSVSGSGYGNYDEDDRHGRRHHQKNFETGSDSSSAEISFQPLRELESVSAGKQFLADDSPLPLAATTTNLLAAAVSHNKRNIHRHLRTHHRATVDGNQQHRRQRYPDESLNEGPIPLFSSAAAVDDLNEISQPDGDEEAAYELVQRDLQGRTGGSGEALPEDESTADDYAWSIFKRQQHPFSFGPTEGQQLLSSLVDDANNKRNALVAFKRQKLKSHQTQFIPSISVGAMTSLGDFFKNLRNNVDFMEKSRFSGAEEHLLEGDHPMRMLKEEFASDGEKPTGTAAFLHAIRNYRPSQRIRSLVSLNPEGYHGSQFLDPNYMWVGLGKRK